MPGIRPPTRRLLPVGTIEEDTVLLVSLARDVGSCCDRFSSFAQALRSATRWRSS
jgi:hypothetical protein